MSSTLVPTKMNRMVPTARSTLAPNMISLASARSTITPAMALNATAGKRNVRIRTAFAVFEPVVPTTIAISPARTMLLASWLRTCAVQSDTKERLAKMLPAPARSWPPRSSRRWRSGSARESCRCARYSPRWAPAAGSGPASRAYGAAAGARCGTTWCSPNASARPGQRVHTGER